MFSPEAKGKLNKLNIKDKVKAKPSLIDWYATHLAWSYGKKTYQVGYGENEKEIHEEDLSKIYLWTKAKLFNEILTGTVAHYGSRDNDNRIDRKTVYVVFSIKTKNGKLSHGSYVEEKNLTKIKNKAKK